MPVRSTLSDLIARVRTMIGDPPTNAAFFQNQDIQTTLDENREDIRYLNLAIAPSIVNTASTNNQASTIFADYYSIGYKWWEADVELQGYLNGAYWKELTPVSSDLITGHWTFEADVFHTGTAPGQLPAVFATGKTFDLNATSADLLEFWAASLAGAYDVMVDGQQLRRSQLMAAKLTLANYYRLRAKPKMAKLVRGDIMPELSTRRVRLLDSDDIAKGA